MNETTGDFSNLLDEIRGLEETLHRHDTRRSRAAVEALLAEDFVEFGSSGRVYQRRQMIELLAQEEKDDTTTLVACDYLLRAISADAVLLTYRTCRRMADGSERSVLRSSIWQRGSGGWKMLFHQGTVSPDRPVASESSGARPIMP